MQNKNLRQPTRSASTRRSAHGTIWVPQVPPLGPGTAHRSSEPARVPQVPPLGPGIAHRSPEPARVPQVRTFGPGRLPRPSEQGYLLVAVVFILAILIVSMAVALPKVRESIQRDRDLETMHRGKQYIRAIQLYYRKFNAYPPNVDALVKTNEIRFLRKKYIDPTTGKEEWKPVLFGQNKTPTAMGFFGQPLAGSTMAGIGPSGGNGLNGVNGNGLGNNTNGGAFGSSNGSAFGNNNGSAFGNNNSNSAFGSNNGSAFGNNNGATGATGSSTDGSSTGTGTGSGDGSSGSASAFGGPGTGSGGQTFGGAGIIGFSPGSPKQSIYVYKKKNHYNEWEFTYDPAQERMMLGGGGNNGLGQPTPGAVPGIGNSPGFGNTPGGITPTPPVTPPSSGPTPQQ
jgi:type II secretory pathway pseudopilin PulG